MSETEIYTLLATGRSTLERNSGASMTGSQAASVVGSLVASQARKAMAAELPLDVFSIEAGEGRPGGHEAGGGHVPDGQDLRGLHGPRGHTADGGRAVRTPTRSASSTSSARSGAWKPTTETRAQEAWTSSGARNTEPNPLPSGEGRGEGFRAPVPRRLNCSPLGAPPKSSLRFALPARACLEKEPRMRTTSVFSLPFIAVSLSLGLGGCSSEAVSGGHHRAGRAPAGHRHLL